MELINEFTSDLAYRQWLYFKNMMVKEGFINVDQVIKKLHNYLMTPVFFYYKKNETIVIFYRTKDGLIIYEQSKLNGCRPYGDFYVHDADVKLDYFLETFYGTHVSEIKDNKYIRQHIPFKEKNLLAIPEDKIIYLPILLLFRNGNKSYDEEPNIFFNWKKVNSLIIKDII